MTQGAVFFVKISSLLTFTRHYTNMIHSKYLLLTVLLFFAIVLTAQRLDHRQGQLIVQLQEGAEVKDLLRRFPAFTQHETAVKKINSHILFFDHDAFSANSLKQALSRDKAVMAVQFNHLLAARSTIPNDPQFHQQWPLRNTGQSGGTVGADFNVCTAWDITTGGITPNGDTIVICVVDNGIDPTHPDLLPNLWVNHHEIPNNGIDDDNNGYVDDYYGWNSRLNSSDISGGSHGTQVSGVVGAKGNNNLGVSGINWNTRLMIVNNGFLVSESEVLKAYGYAIEARERYDASNGAMGAYVVATNSSWGLDRANAADSPIWCSLYDVMGQMGILSAAATINGNVNVDVEGDMPTNCPSDFLLGVTSATHNNEKSFGAGYGTHSIELGAYGVNVRTTTNGGNYATVSGTSLAAPAVAGAIGLLYSAPNLAFGELLAADPAFAALLVKDMILSTVRLSPSFDTSSVSGGILDIGAAMEAMMNFSLECFPPLTIRLQPAGTDGIQLNFNVTSLVDSVQLRYRVQGSSTWASISSVSSPYALDGLQSCTTYELQLLSQCAEENQTSDIFTIQTDGCCSAPSPIEISNIAPSNLTLSWPAVLAARRYQLRYRPSGSVGAWTERIVLGTTTNLSNLQPCTLYEVGISSNCDSTLSATETMFTFLSGGCGACIDLNYCIPSAPDNSEEWIALVDLGGLVENPSGQATNGYIDYGELEGSTLARGGVYPIRLQPQHSGTAFTESFKIWVDWDQNGFFSSSEQVGAATSSSGRVVNIPLTVPVNAPLGLPRMRVVMEFLNVQSACNTLTRPGETEDYCIRIIESPGCVPPERLRATYDEVTETVQLRWPASLAPGGEYFVRYRRRNTTEWISSTTNELQLTITDFPLCDLYDAQVASYCDGQPGEFVEAVFNSCSDTRERGISAADWQLSPNPGHSWLRLSWEAALSPVQLEIFNSQGQRLQQRALLRQLGDWTEDASQLPTGVYWLRLTDTEGRVGTKRWVKH